MSTPHAGPPGAEYQQQVTPEESLFLTRADAHDALVDVLARAGFDRDDDVVDVGEGWYGVLTFRPAGVGQAELSTVVTIAILENFPFTPPKVTPGPRAWGEELTGRTFGAGYYDAGRGWHRDGNLAMCLFDDADHRRLRWANGDTLLDQARAWLAQDAAGWPDGAPALDLQRYLPAAGEHRILLYGPLDDLDGVVLRVQAKRHNVLQLHHRASQQRSGTRARRHRWSPTDVMILDARELTGPVRSWNDLCTAIGNDRSERLNHARAVGLRWVLVTYRRQGVSAALGLEVTNGPDGKALLRALRTAPDDQATRLIRAGTGAGALSQKRVTIVGVGAIGSVAADLLHRSGIGHLHLIDADIVLPGNTTRHLLGEQAVGQHKAHAVATALRAARPLGGEVTVEDGEVATARGALRVLTTADLVLDATADSTATAVLTLASKAGAGQLVSVAVLADGYAIRVDRHPLPEGAESLPAPDLPPLVPAVYEAGCGSPVSTTPPAGVWEAAAMATRHVLDVLLNETNTSVGEQRQLHLDGAADV